MKWVNETVTVRSSGQGLHEFTGEVESLIRKHKAGEGMCMLFIKHTSASLVISENADPTAKMDLEQFMNRLAPEDQDWYRHTMEGKDDSPSHMKSILTPVSLQIPISGGSLDLGTWQGIYLFEHRNRPHSRKISISLLIA